VVFVTWYGAAEYAKYVGGALPTESQWEYACRARYVTCFSTGGYLTNLQANYEWSMPITGSVNTVKIALNKTQAVGSYPANDYGLYDMHGNALEWCADWYGDYPTTTQTNPTGATTGTERCIRGGGWANSAAACRSACRWKDVPTQNMSDTSFRVVFP